MIMDRLRVGLQVVVKKERHGLLDCSCQLLATGNKQECEGCFLCVWWLGLLLVLDQKCWSLRKIDIWHQNIMDFVTGCVCASYTPTYLSSVMANLPHLRAARPRPSVKYAVNYTENDNGQWERTIGVHFTFTKVAISRPSQHYAGPTVCQTIILN